MGEGNQKQNYVLSILGLYLTLRTEKRYLPNILLSYLEIISSYKTDKEPSPLPR